MQTFRRNINGPQLELNESIDDFIERHFIGRQLSVRTPDATGKEQTFIYKAICFYQNWLIKKRFRQTSCCSHVTYKQYY